MVWEIIASLGAEESDLSESAGVGTEEADEFVDDEFEDVEFGG